ncbi:DUF4159 domain-containing protein [Marinicauda sp. Alg238-R41]|uniref:DUF4159 domain-containing protein n=1 Tax=Marinicauda sp. Alg238-R41 TaxID=2993447 RepID=UPI0022E0C7D9|nr:DUF4159 domain-containing protein [Marinicauda sp. Alg238-R41]
MIALGPLAFAAPLALLGLLALPLLFMVLRATPPSPSNVVFAPIRLLRQIARTPETPQTTPLWLIVLRLVLAALLVIALARPVWRPDTEAGADLPVLVVLDSGWTSASNWRAMTGEARSALERASASGRDAALILTAQANRSEEASELRFAPARESLARLAAVEPQAWAHHRGQAAERVETLFSDERAPDRVRTLWISDGIESDGSRTLSQALSARGPLIVSVPEPGNEPVALRPAEANAEGFSVTLVRPPGAPARSVEVVAVADAGQALARGEARFEDGADTASFSARVPLDLRNRLRLIRVEGESSAGATQLTDDSWQRPRVGLIEPAGGEQDQPLLSDLHYAGEALAPHAEVLRSPLDALLEAEPSVLVMVDAAREDSERVNAFVEAGGVLLRFAGPRLATRGDTLLPVALRTGGRLFGGAMAWDNPQRLDHFTEDSPFAGLTLPEDVSVSRQVLAEPGPALDARVWARLEDGTPLVTAERRGEGWIVLFHVTAGPAWSDLPLSGLYPAMLRRVLSLAGRSAAGAPSQGAWQIDRALDGLGRLGEPQGRTHPIPAAAFSEAEPGPHTPPGLWQLGAASAALNVADDATELVRLPRDLPGAVVTTREGGGEIRLTGLLLTLAALLLVTDILIALALTGRLRPARSGLGALAMAVVLLPAGAFDAQAQDAAISDAEAMDRALEVRFGYVQTGNAEIDRMSRAGLTGLGQTIFNRTAIEPGEPRAIQIESDPILFYPMIYWPVTRDAEALSPNASARIEAYLQSGGLVIFDTRDAGLSGLGGTPHPGLVRILDSIDIPPLDRITPDHVLGRTFYLLDDFPGRYGGGNVWVEADPDGSSRDGTSGVIIGGADWASAWATGPDGQPLAPVEGGDRQRELAHRTGVNFAMYALTGNYKADQVHIPAILDRLGQD